MKQYKLKLVEKTIYDVTTIVRSLIVFRIVSLQCYNLCFVTLQHNDGNNYFAIKGQINVSTITKVSSALLRTANPG